MVCRGFLSPLKAIASAGFQPATPGSSAKHTSNYTTEATITAVTTHTISNVLYQPDLSSTRRVDEWRKYGDEVRTCFEVFCMLTMQ
jgi:hypothetical protein